MEVPGPNYLVNLYFHIFLKENAAAFYFNIGLLHVYNNVRRLAMHRAYHSFGGFGNFVLERFRSF